MPDHCPRTVLRRYLGAELQLFLELLYQYGLFIGGGRGRGVWRGRHLSILHHVCKPLRSLW